MRIRSWVGWWALAAAACGAPRLDSGAAVLDDLGRPVRLAHPAARIVSLSPSITELLFDLGLGERLVGRTRWCDFPPEVRAVPSVGNGLDPDVELIVARRPDLVLFYASRSNQRAISRLSQLGIASASVRLDRLEDLPRAWRLVGRLAGAARRADSLAAAFTARLDSARSARPQAGTRVAVIVWSQPPMVIGAGSFLSQILELAGARNVFGDLPQPSATVSIEALAARDPDAIVVLGDRLASSWADRPEWQSVRAVRQGRLLRLAGSQFERPSLRAFEAVIAARAALSALP